MKNDIVKQIFRSFKDSVDQNKDLDKLGKFFLKTYLTLSKVRDRIEFFYQQNPHHCQDPKKIVMILGMPRTGSTFLQRLLVSDQSGIIGFNSTELSYPTYHLETSRFRLKAIINSTIKKGLCFINHPSNYLRLQDLHSFDILKPEEDDLLFNSIYFNLATSITFGAHNHILNTLNDDSYADELYNFYQKALKVLYYSKLENLNLEVASLILKGPSHSSRIDILDKNISNIKYIWLHRDPVEVVESFLNLIYRLAYQHNKNITPKIIGDLYIDYILDMFNKALVARNQIDPNQILDIASKDLRSDPYDVVVKIFNFAEITLSSTYLDNIKYKLKSRKKILKFKGFKKIKLEEFGVARSYVESRLADYLINYKDFV